jgi:hypothetical protein
MIRWLLKLAAVVGVLVVLAYMFQQRPELQRRIKSRAEAVAGRVADSHFLSRISPAPPLGRDRNHPVEATPVAFSTNNPVSLEPTVLETSPPAAPAIRPLAALDISEPSVPTAPAFASVQSERDRLLQTLEKLRETRAVLSEER